MDKIRAFLAIDFHSFYEEELRDLVRILGRQIADIKWIQPESAHLTLNFFGSIDAATVDAIGQCLRTPCEKQRPFEISLHRVGAFPSIVRPRVIWVGLEGEVAELRCLKECIDDALQNIGIPVAQWPFKAHLTLGRFRRSPNRPARLPGDVLAFSSTSSFKVRELVLFKSVLLREGPQYSPLHVFPLARVQDEGG